MGDVSYFILFFFCDRSGRCSVNLSEENIQKENNEKQDALSLKAH